MPRWEYMVNPSSMESQRTRSRSRGDATHHFSLLQGGQRSSHLNQRGFVSPRSIMRMSSDYEAMNDFSDVSPPTGYLTPGTHPIPVLDEDGRGGGQGPGQCQGQGPPSCTYGRRSTPRPSNLSMSNRPPPGFGSRLGYGQTRGQVQSQGQIQGQSHLYHESHHTLYPPNNSYNSRVHSLGPIFPEEEEDSFFPSETLPPIDEIFSEYARGDEDYLGNSTGYPPLHDVSTREKFQERLASFPEVPLDAHRRIFLMGNEIVDCFEVRLDRFYRGSLLDAVSDCVAVFTKKERTGQRWLMVFKEDITRTVVKFNRLLTHSLLVSVVSPTGIEIEAAKSLYGPPAEMCVLNFVNMEDASRFYKTLQEGQTTAWNHREVTHEQRMKNVFSRINQVIAQADLEMGSGPSPSTIGIASGSGGGSGGGGVRIMPLSGSVSGDVPQSRSPFTFSLRNRSGSGGDGGSMSQVQCQGQGQRSPLPSKVPGSLRTVSRSPSASVSTPSEAYQQHLADLDDDWRNNRGRRGSGDRPEFVGAEVHGSSSRERRERPRSTTSSQNRLLKKSLTLNSKGQLGQGQGGLRQDNGSGDCYTSAGKIMSGSETGSGLIMKCRIEPTVESIPGDVIFQVNVTVFVKLDPGDYGEFGTGTLQLLDHQDAALNELRLLDGDKREILQQYIYKWNTALKRSSSDDLHQAKGAKPVCTWDGAVCFSLEPDAVPERRDFKMRLTSEEDADRFVKGFMMSVEKARDESIRKRHISWYLQNKRDYKKITANNSGSGSQ